MRRHAVSEMLCSITVAALQVRALPVALLWSLHVTSAALHRRAKNRDAARRMRERRMNTIKSLGEQVWAHDICARPMVTPTARALGVPL